MHVSCTCGRRGHTRMRVRLLHNNMHSNRLPLSFEVNMAVTDAFSDTPLTLGDEMIASSHFAVQVSCVLLK
jgi:hypothetical protein